MDGNDGGDMDAAARHAVPDEPLARAGDAALMGHMRLGEAAAFREFFARFAPMLRELAARHGAPDEALVVDVLDDVAERIRALGVPRDAALAPYLARVLRNRLAGAYRDRDRHARLERDAADPLDGEGERAVRATCSAYALRAARGGHDDEDARAGEAARALHDFVAALLTDEERRILGWLGERVSQREIAEWTGATHGATRVRVHRLRARVGAAVRAWLATLDPEPRERIERTWLRDGRPTLARRAPVPAREEDDA